jgi:uncharacterized membrane protein YdjX (TVP38/TMEM64 family)
MEPTVRRGLAGAAVAALVLAGLALSPGSLLESLGSAAASPWFPVVLVGLYLARPFLAWPITALSVLVGVRYGLVAGVPLALTGAVATSLIPYAAARRFRPREGLLGRLADRSEGYFERTGDLRGVVAARLAPTPAEAISAGAGAANVRLGAFVLGTAVGELPWTIAAVLAGASVGQVATGTAVDPRLVAGGALAGAALLAGPAYRYARERSAAPS